MDFKEIMTFMNLIKTGSYSNTAKALYISQPTATAQIKALESELGIKLLKRTVKGYLPTEAGTVFAVYAGRILQIQDECFGALSQISGLRTGTIRIGTTAIGTYVVPSITAKFKKSNPQTKLFFSISNTEEAIDSLKNGLVDVVLAAYTPDTDDSDLYFKVVGYDKLVLISSAENPISKLRNIQIKDLNNENFIVREHGSNTRKIFNEWLHKNELDAHGNITEIGQTEAIYRAVTQNIGISMISTFSLRPKDENVKILDFADFPFTRQINVITRKNHKNSIPINEFIKSVEEYMNEYESSSDLQQSD